MALSLVSEPADYTSAFRPIVQVLDTSVVGLQYVQFNLYNDLTGSLISSNNKRYDFADTDTFSFDYTLQIRQELGVDIDSLTVNGTKINATNILKQFRIDATEKMLSGGSFVDGDTYTGNGFYIVNASPAIGEASYATQGYFTTGSGVKLLTNKPTFKTSQGESEYVALFNDGEDITVSIAVTDEDGTVTNGATAALTAGNQVTYMGIGYANINAYTLSSGSQPLLTATSASYTVTFTTASSTFEVVNMSIAPVPCGTNIRFHFQNVFGAIDSYTFTGFDEKSINTLSDRAQKVITDYSSTESYGRFIANTEKRSVYRAGTENITQAVREWLEEMLSSSNVWVQSGSDYLPVLLNHDQDFRISTNRFNQDIFTLNVEYEFANNLRRQGN